MDVREGYLAVWNETDATARERLLARDWAPEAVYVDPLGEAVGARAVSRTVEAVQAQFPGHVFTPVGDVDAHHGVARFQWGLGLPGQEPAVVGFDVVTLDEQSRISSVAGFIDRMPG